MQRELPLACVDAERQVSGSMISVANGGFEWSGTAAGHRSRHGRNDCISGGWPSYRPGAESRRLG